MSQKQTLLLVFAMAAVGFSEAFHLPEHPLIRTNNVGLDYGVQTGVSTECTSHEKSTSQRRLFIKQAVLSASSALVLAPQLVFAETETQQPGAAYVSPPNQKFSYTVTPPPSFTTGNKPLKTHLDEINFSSQDVRGYTIGITVDPVRIKSIREFGTPEEVAARVVTAEVNRDGVFQVTLAKDPVEDANGCYDIEYISEGKRGIKRFVTRIYIKDGFLYVLTAQSKNDEYDKEREMEVLASVKSFRPL